MVRGDVVLPGLEERGLGPSADQGVPAAAALALLLQDREADHARPAAVTSAWKVWYVSQSSADLRGGDGRPLAAGEGELQAVLAGGRVLGAPLDLDRRLRDFGSRQFQVRPALEVGGVLEVEQRFVGGRRRGVGPGESAGRAEEECQEGKCPTHEVLSAGVGGATIRVIQSFLRGPGRCKTEGNRSSGSVLRSTKGRAMLTIRGGRANRFCDGVSRRDFLRVGTLGVAGLTFGDLLRLRAEQPAAGKLSRKAVIMVYLPGGPPHLDTYDLKPDAPVEVPRRVQADQNQRARPRRSANCCRCRPRWPTASPSSAASSSPTPTTGPKRW